ncbi:MAG TPA: hypothetical protein VE733_03865, partial [Streptosporangiaceae bacterium]|nr:hypothetical protein [Streptosporangiaceae bacterium]
MAADGVLGVQPQRVVNDRRSRPSTAPSTIRRCAVAVRPAVRSSDNDSDIGTLTRAEAVTDPHLRPAPGLVPHAAQLGGVVKVWMLAVGAA